MDANEFETSEPIIRAMPTVEEFMDEVDRVFSGDGISNDDQIRSLINLIMVPANPEDNASWELAMTAARHAYAQSEHFERAFREFAGWPERPSMRADRIMVIAPGKEM